MIRKIFIPQKNNRKRSLGLHEYALSGYIAVIMFFMLLGYAVSIGYGDVLGYANNISSSRLLADTNSRRKAAGLNSLTMNASLSKAAKAKANDMFKYNYWAHVSPTGTSPWYFFDKVGYDYIYAGENLAVDFQNSDDVVDAWYNSPAHRDNLLNKHYTEIGFAVVNGKLNGRETTLVVQLFGKPRVITTAAVPKANQNTNVKANPNPNSTESVLEKKEVEPFNELAQSPPTGPLNVVPETEKENELNPNTNTNVPVPVENDNGFFNESVPNDGTTIVSPSETQGRVLNSSVVFNVSKYIALIIGLFLTLLFSIDGYYVRMYGINRISGHTIFHVLLLILVILGIWYTNIGLVL